MFEYFSHNLVLSSPARFFKQKTSRNTLFHSNCDVSQVRYTKLILHIQSRYFISYSISKLINIVCSISSNKQFISNLVGSIFETSFSTIQLQTVKKEVASSMNFKLMEILNTF